MGTWIQLRCESRYEPYAYSHNGSHCLSHHNDEPQAEARDNRKSLLATIQRVEAHAARTGWTKARAGWVCPHCTRSAQVTLNGS